MFCDVNLDEFPITFVIIHYVQKIPYMKVPCNWIVRTGFMEDNVPCLESLSDVTVIKYI
jgi:hypothetical protein